MLPLRVSVIRVKWFLPKNQPPFGTGKRKVRALLDQTEGLGTKQILTGSHQQGTKTVAPLTHTDFSF